MAAGRPREHDREQIAIDIIEWAKKEDSINVNKFCAYYDPIIPPTNLSIWSSQDDEFRKAYECAKSFLGFRREELLNKNKLHVKAYDLNACTYDLLLRQEKRDQQAYEKSIESQRDKSSKDQNTLFGVATEIDTQNRGAAITEQGMETKESISSQNT